MLKSFFAELKLRNVRKTMAIYISSALTTIGVVKLFTEVYDLPAAVFNIVVVFLTSGIVSAFVFAWHHGSAGSQRIQKTEILYHSLVVVAAIILSFRVTGTRRPVQLSSDAKVIAVLPFKNMSESKEDEFFSDGVTEDILTQLSKIGDLKVISRTSVMRYKNTDKSIREIGHELDAGSILEGSVRRVGDRVRIVGQLINATTDEHVWAETYDRDMRDVFAIQSEVAQQIAFALKAKLSPDEKERIEKKATTSTEAYAFYLRGREHYNRYKKDENELAIKFFKEALALDPTYALAYAGLGDAYGQRVEKRYGYDNSWIDSALAMCNKAISIDPNLAEPYKGRGVVYFQRGQFQRALTEYLKAVELNPNYAPAVSNLGSIYWWTGRYDDALPLWKKNIVLNPTQAKGYHSLGILYHGLVMDSLAEHFFRQALKLQPDFAASEVYLTRMYLTHREFQRARNEVTEALTRLPDNPALLNAGGDVELFTGHLGEAEKLYERAGVATERAFIHWKNNRKADALPIIKNILKENQAQIEQGSEEFTPAYELARVQAFQGHTAESLVWLKKAVDNGWLYYGWTLEDPLLESVRENNTFKQLIDQAKARVDAMRMKIIDEEL
jgi:TolB-like protein/Flp pilus assembly protein TadD